MALRTVGTLATTQLACLTNWSQVIPALDLAAIGAAITSDAGFGALIMGQLRPSYVLATGQTTAGANALTSVVARAGSPPVSTIRVGDLVLGKASDIVPGTCVATVVSGGVTLQISQPALSLDVAAPLAFVRQDGFFSIGREAQLAVPGRGMLKVLPGDIVAVDSTGFPILISGNSIAYAGSDWTLT